MSVAGFAVAAAGLWFRSPSLLLASLAFDIADGAIARGLGACTRFGAELDYFGDLVIALAIVLVAAPFPLSLYFASCICIGAVVAHLVYEGPRVRPRWSGRALVTVIAAAGWAV